MLFGFLTWEELAWSLFVAAPAQLVALYMEMRILALKRKRVFWILECIIAFGLTPFRVLMPMSVRMLVALTVSLVLPVVCTCGSLMWRIIIALTVFLLQNIAELPSAFAWTVMTGTAYTDEVMIQNLPAVFAVEPLFIASTVALISLLHVIVNKRMDVGVESAKSAAPVLVAVAQPAAFFLCTTLVIRYFAQGDVGAGFYTGMVLVAACQVSAVLLLCVSADQYASKRSADVRAEVLARGVEEQLGAYAQVVRRVENVAKVRHDLRNQAQAAPLAADAGERGRARAQVEEMLAVAKGAGE